MASGDDLPAAGETVEEPPVALAEFAPGGLAPDGNEPRRPVTEGTERVPRRTVRPLITPRGGVPPGTPVAFVFHRGAWRRTNKSFSLAPPTDTETDRRSRFIRDPPVSVGMDRVERGVAVEAESDAEEPFAPTFGLGARREIVEFLTLLVIVLVLAAATSVVLLPA